MCPEDSVLSAYYDGELEAERSEDLSAHISMCERCRGILEGFETTTRQLRESQVPDFSHAMEDTSRRVSARLYREPVLPIWRRNVRIPAFAAGAVLLLVIGLAAGLIYKMHPVAPSVAMNRVTEQEISKVNTAALDEVIKYLDSTNAGGQEMTFTFPSGTPIKMISEPKLIRAIDFQQRGR